MNWISIQNPEELEQIDQWSKEAPVLLFKHSTRCSISSAALNRLETAWKEENSAALKPVYIDLIRFRPLSNAIASRYGIEHESPQALVISNGKCVYSESHFGINYRDLLAAAKV